MTRWAPWREPFPRSLPYRLGLTVVVGLLLVGCGKHYWSKPGSGAANATPGAASAPALALSARGWPAGNQAPGRLRS